MRKLEDGPEVAADAYLTPREVAALFQVSPKTVSRWADGGLLPCETTLGGHRRFSASAIEAVRAARRAAPA